MLTFFNLRRNLRLVIEFENHYMHELRIVVRFILLRLSVRVKILARISATNELVLMSIDDIG